MPTNNEEYGVVLGIQEIASGAIITPKMPSVWNYPSSSDPRINNILFNNQQGSGWIIVGPDGDEHIGEYLTENAPFDYGTDITVKANWLKKIQVNIWCYDNPSVAISDLQPNINVLGDNGVGMVNDEYGKHVFYPDNAQVQFVVTGANSNKIITVSGRVYRFIAWARTPPPEILSNRWEICTFDVTDNTHPAIVFNNDCIWDEYAVFLYGADVHVIVKTNVEKWNNYEPYRYCINWRHNSSNPRRFNSVPLNPNNPAYIVPSANVGEEFSVDAKDINNGTLNFIEGTNKLRGWYFGNYQGGQNADAFEAIQSSDYYSPCTDENYTSPNYRALQSEIIITAIYMPSSETFTITYYSGLPNYNS